jgi:hypothetical protein
LRYFLVSLNDTAGVTGVTCWEPPKECARHSAALAAARVFAVRADPATQSIREYLQFPPFGPEQLTNSLHHLAELAAATREPEGEEKTARGYILARKPGHPGI